MTNKPFGFQKSRVTETGISDFHKLISVFSKSHFSRLKPKTITYRNYKKFSENEFLKDLEDLNITLNPKDANQNYDLLTNEFLKVINRHAPLKKKND